MERSYYSSTIDNFRIASHNTILGELTKKSDFSVDQAQRDAWLEEIRILNEILAPFNGSIYFEFSIPRMDKRIDTVLIIGSVIFILEFKVGEKKFHSHDIDQVWDYALELKYFHQTSHDCIIAPILISTNADALYTVISQSPQHDKILTPLLSNTNTLTSIIQSVLQNSDDVAIDPISWINGSYCPTPTIVEAAMALWGGHKVEDISRNDAGAINLKQTSETISQIIAQSKENKQKSICFVTGVPGAGKTLVGLNIAQKHINKEEDVYSVFLSGNGPLVQVLREALARDKVRREKEKKNKITKSSAMTEVKMFIQNVHNFRDEGLIDREKAPAEHVVLFDEAQRAWTKEKTIDFMKRKKHISDFDQSEPEFLISCMDRFCDWAVIVCLVGGGQEINTGEAGISEWIESLKRSYHDWKIYISPQLQDSEYAAVETLEQLKSMMHVNYRRELHLSVSMRSFRAEHVSLLVKKLLDLEIEEANRHYLELKDKYPIVITRNLHAAKKWLKEKARGSERYGIVVSSQAERLKPHAIDVKSPVDPRHWFLSSKEDVRSSYYLEDVATEFHIQGLELDWVCVTWDADFRFVNNQWEHWSFKGKRWEKIKKEERKHYLKNAYRVLLTRARQGMVIVVPQGDKEDHTRKPQFYDPIYHYLQKIGFIEI